MRRLCIAALIGFLLAGNLYDTASAQQAEEKKNSQKDKKGTKIRNKKICITFDNLPAERHYSKAERAEINETVLSALKEHEVPAAGFVVGDNIEGDWGIIVNWLEDGHTIGIMSYSGQDIENVPVEMFLGDITRAKETIEDIVWSFKQKGRYFRFPYLHYGSKPEIKKEVQDFLDELHLTVAHASIVTEDFVYNLSFEKTFKSHDSLKLVSFRDEYIDHILERLGYSEGLAIESMDRPVRHILQLRVNRLNAAFLNDILAAIADKGYQFISLRDALKDKVYSMPDAYYEMRGVSFLARLKYSNPDLLPASD